MCASFRVNQIIDYSVFTTGTVRLCQRHV